MKVIKHSLRMVKKTYKNYLLLSVTAFLSFSLMLGYLIFSDSNIYNKYNELFGASPNIILSDNDASYETQLNIKKLTNQLEKTPNSYYYMDKKTLATTSFDTECEVNMMPEYVWGMFTHATLNGYSGVSRLKINNQWQFSLHENEAVVSQSMYDNLKRKAPNMEISLVFKGRKGEKIFRTYKIVGAYSSKIFEIENTGRKLNSDPVFVSMSSLQGENIEIENLSLVIYTERVEFITKQMQKMDLAQVNVNEDQNDATLEKINITKSKYLIAAVLFILLGINLYSSFANALKERKFEIGVKRALGASKVHIMLQFVLEGFVVMLINIIFSICVVTNIVVAYKLIQLRVFHNEYVIIMSPQSVLLFLVFSFFLTFIFSALFAYQSTRVEIIKYLKEE